MEVGVIKPSVCRRGAGRQSCKGLSLTAAVGSSSQQHMAEHGGKVQMEHVGWLRSKIRTDQWHKQEDANSLPADEVM